MNRERVIRRLEEIAEALKPLNDIKTTDITIPKLNIGAKNDGSSN